MNIIIYYKILNEKEITLFRNISDNDYAYFLCISNFFYLRIYELLAHYCIINTKLVYKEIKNYIRS